jgi:signal transduction histidine kinase
VTNIEPRTKKSFLTRFGFGAPAVKTSAEQSRLEAFLSAFPGQYCGWSSDDSVAYSQGFCDVLGLGGIKTFADVQGRLSPGDGAALEGLFDRLRNEGIAFTINANSHNEKKVFKISGSRGTDRSGENHYSVLWVEDLTDLSKAQDDFLAEAQRNERHLLQMMTALNVMPRPVWLRDDRQKITWCNDTYAEFLNTTREKVIAEQKEIAAQAIKKKTAVREKDSDILPGSALAAAALKAGHEQETNVHLVVKGSRMWLRIIEIPLPGLSMTMGIAYNNTREEDLETELKRHQSSNRELLGQLRTAIAIFSADERLEFYNAAYAQLWHLEDQWLNTLPRLGDVMEKLRDTRRLPEQTDFRRYKQSWLDMFTSLIDPHDDMLYLPDGSALRMLVIPHSMGGLMMTFEDVTSRLQLESSYNTLIAVQKETLDNLGEAVAVYGGDGRLKLCNPSFGRMWNLNPEDLEGEPHITKVVEKKKIFFPTVEWTGRKDELVSHGLDRLMHEGRIQRKDGSLLDFTTVPLPDGGVLITYTDVTDTVRVENALREKNAALEAAEQLKLDFLANVSYQLRTPLNAIMGFNEILSHEYFGPLNARQKEYTRDITGASERLLGLINDILDLSTLEAGHLELERQPVDLARLLQDVLDLVTGWARKAQLEITLDVPKAINTIMVDPRRLQQAIINLIRNAIAFSPAGGKINIHAHETDEAITITVSDTGSGIAPEDIARIFEPFERAQNNASNGRVSRGGAGLGLSLVKKIVTLHEGDVSITSTPGEGTIVTISLPRAAALKNKVALYS